MKETNNKKKVIIASVICLVIVTIMTPVILSCVFSQNQDAAINFKQEVTVTDEKAEPEMSSLELPILREGTYRFHMEWEWKAQQPAFVSGCVVKDEHGQVVFAVTGNNVIVDSIEMRLEPQIYKVEIHYLANEQDYIRFVTDYIVGKDGAAAGKTTKIAEFDPEGIGNDGTWRMDYVIVAQVTTNALTVGVVIGLIVGIICVVLLLAVTKTDENVKYKYDERQELVRGRGFKYGFFILLINNAIIFFLEMTDIPIYAEAEVTAVINCFLGISVYVAYCIWNEGYFALNENKNRLMTIFIFIGIFNFIISAASFIQGTMVQDGKLTYHSLNFFCGLLFVVVFVTMLLKKIFKDGKDEQA